MNTIRCDSCRKVIIFDDKVLERNKGKKFAWTFCSHCGNATLIINKGEPLYETDEDLTLTTPIDVKPKRRGRKPKNTEVKPKKTTTKPKKGETDA
jgi:hypothetical protein